MKTTLKRSARLAFSLALALVLSIGAVTPALAGEVINSDSVWGGYWNGGTRADTQNAEQVMNASGLGSEDPRAIVASVINVILGFLGIIAVVLILVAGFMWMTAAGNEDKIGTAKKIMAAGVVGLVIVLAAFGIARFVVNALVSATTA